jgi:hypothetical protein
MTVIKVTRRKRVQRGVRLTWDIPTLTENGNALEDLVGFRLRVGTSVGATTHTITLMDPAATSYVWYHEDFEKGETWYYRIHAIRDNGEEIESDASTERSITY